MAGWIQVNFDTYFILITKEIKWFFFKIDCEARNLDFLMSIFRRRICHELPKLPPVISLKSSEITGSKRINPAITIRFQNELKNFMLLLNTIRSRGIGFLKGWDYMKFTLLILNIDRLYILMKGRRLCLLLCIALSDGIIRGIIKFYYL